jgi:hypothetical protein
MRSLNSIFTGLPFCYESHDYYDVQVRLCVCNMVSSGTTITPWLWLVYNQRTAND